MVLFVYLRLTWTEMETWTWQVLLVTIKLHGTKTRTAKALLEVNRSCRRVRNGANSVFAADLDGDGDMDLASASDFDDKIAWYENTDGKGTFGSQQIVSTSADYARSVFAADLDGDGDMDLASASSYDDKIAWYENTDGKGTFGSQQIVSTSADGASSVFAADLDGDGDMDLASASSMTIKLHGTKTWTAKALLEVNRSCRRVRMVLIVYLRLTWTEMETWTWQVLLSMTIKLHGTKT